MTGDLLRLFGIRFPLTSFRLRNMTADNVIDMSPTFGLTGPGPYTLADGIEETARWLNDETSSKPV